MDTAVALAIRMLGIRGRAVAGVGKQAVERAGAVRISPRTGIGAVVAGPVWEGDAGDAVGRPVAAEVKRRLSGLAGTVAGSVTVMVPSSGPPPVKWTLVGVTAALTLGLPGAAVAVAR